MLFYDGSVAIKSVIHPSFHGFFLSFGILLVTAQCSSRCSSVSIECLAASNHTSPQLRHSLSARTIGFPSGEEQDPPPSPRSITPTTLLGRNLQIQEPHRPRPTIHLPPSHNSSRTSSNPTARLSTHYRRLSIDLVSSTSRSTLQTLLNQLNHYALWGMSLPAPPPTLSSPELP